MQMYPTAKNDDTGASPGGHACYSDELLRKKKAAFVKLARR
jgi:hypothetical protein